MFQSKPTSKRKTRPRAQASRRALATRCADTSSTSGLRSSSSAPSAAQTAQIMTRAHRHLLRRDRRPPTRGLSRPTRHARPSPNTPPNERRLTRTHPLLGPSAENIPPPSPHHGARDREGTARPYAPIRTALCHRGSYCSPAGATLARGRHPAQVVCRGSCAPFAPPPVPALNSPAGRC